jgi:hypothetical protein
VSAGIKRRHWDSSCWQDLGMVDPHGPIDEKTFPAYAWPGGYPIAYVDPEDESEALCADTVREMVIAGEWPEGRTIDSQTYYEGPALECVCGKTIESAYGDPDAPDGAESEGFES